MAFLGISLRRQFEFQHIVIERFFLLRISPANS